MISGSVGQRKIGGQVGVLCSLLTSRHTVFRWKDSSRVRARPEKYRGRLGGRPQLLERSDRVDEILRLGTGHRALKREGSVPRQCYWRLELEALMPVSAWRQKLGSKSHLRMLPECLPKANGRSSSGNGECNARPTPCATSTNLAQIMDSPAESVPALMRRV